MIIFPTVDTADGAAWRCASGTEPLRCGCGSDDIFSIAPGGEDETQDLMGTRLVVSRGVPSKAFCERCFVEAHR